MPTLFSLFFCFALAGQPATAQPLTVSITDFAPLEGLYTGRLTYTDYQSGDRVAMPLVANLLVEKNRAELWIEINENGRRYQQDLSFKIKNGAVQGWTTQRNAIASEGVLVLENRGRDDRRPAAFRLTLAGSEEGLLITKEVRFLDDDGSEDYFVRNQYALERFSMPADDIPQYRPAAAADMGVANVTIPARQEFVLGEGADYAFRARLENRSGVEVGVRVVNQATGEQVSGFGLGGYGKAKIEVGADAKALLVNDSDQEVTVRVALNRNVAGMRYQPIDQ